MPSRRRASPPSSSGASPSSSSSGAGSTQGASNEQLQEQLTASKPSASFLEGIEAELAKQPAPASEEEASEASPKAATPEVAEPETAEEVVSSEHEAAIELAVAESPAAKVAEPAAPAPGGAQGSQRAAAPAQAPQGPAPDLSATQPGGKGSRPLTEAEIAYARRIYGDSIDYSVVRITSDHLLSTGAPKTIFNTMHMRSQWGSPMFNEDGSFTADGNDLLIHELNHVWQYQNGGAAYIGDSLWAQLKAAVTGDSRDGAYDWRQAMSEGLAFSEWNPEQQAEAVEHYHDLQQKTDEGASLTTAEQADRASLEPIIAQVRAGEGAPEFSVPGAVGGGLGGAAIGALIGSIGGPVGALIGAGIGGLIGGWFGGG